jgi:uncharacterized membrane protein YfcA
VESLSIEIITILFAVAVFAGLIDTIAGGGGLITIPALLSTGMPPISALATNKFQSVFGTFSASLYFVRKKFVDLSQMRWMILIAFVGSIVGSFTLLQIDPSILQKVIPILLMIIGLYFLFSKNVGEVEKHKIVSMLFFTAVVVFAIGFYDGFFGPGTGSFFTIAFIFLLGLNISQATAQTKVLNFATNFGSLLFFLFFADIYFVVGFIMGIGQIIGATLGAKMVIKNGSKIIRPLIVVISFALSIKLLLQ